MSDFNDFVIPEGVKLVRGKPVPVWYKIPLSKTSWRVMKGLASEKDGEIYPLIGLDTNRFRDKPVKLPKNAIRERLDAQQKLQIYNPDAPRVERQPVPPHDDWCMTHDNGGRPFAVLFHKKSVLVRRIPKDRTVWEEDLKMDEEGALPLYSQDVLTLKNVKRVFIGQDIDGSFRGNSVLVEVDPCEYVFIGHEIYSFTAPEPIVYYMSHVGNSDVPYPEAQSASYAFFMLDHCYAPLKEFSLNFGPTTVLYDQFYEHRDALTISPFKNYKILQQRIW